MIGIVIVLRAHNPVYNNWQSIQLDPYVYSVVFEGFGNIQAQK